MTTIGRINAVWSGFVGAPGLSTFYCLDPATFRPALIAFWTSLAPALPGVVTVTVESQGDLVDDVTGDITGSWTDGTDSPHLGGTTGRYAAPSGACVNWKTTAVIGGRRVQGRTFIVPLGGTSTDFDGSLDPTVLATLRTASAALVAATPGQMQILHKPTLAGSPSGPTPGQAVAVAFAQVPDLVAVLRSRRD